MAWSIRNGCTSVDNVVSVTILFSSSSDSTLSISGNLAGSAIIAAISPGNLNGASLKLSKRSISPNEPQPRTLRLPPDNASLTNISTPVATSKVSIPAAANTASIEPLVAMPTSCHPVQAIATARHWPLAERRAISASKTLLAAA